MVSFKLVGLCYYDERLSILLQTFKFNFKLSTFKLKKKTLYIMKTYKLLLATTLFSLFFTSCFEDKDDNPINTLEINNFVYRGMDSYYLYRDLVDDLIEDKANSTTFNNYLNGFDSPEALFESLIYDRQNTDKFSWIVDDYIALEQQFDGITKSNGMEFGLERYVPGGNELYGIVRFILPNTSAETNGLQRGDLFNAVNGVQLTVNNWRSLLSQDNLTLNLAEYNNKWNLYHRRR